MGEYNLLFSYWFTCCRLCSTIILILNILSIIFYNCTKIIIFVDCNRQNLYILKYKIQYHSILR